MMRSGICNGLEVELCVLEVLALNGAGGGSVKGEVQRVVSLCQGGQRLAGPPLAPYSEQPSRWSRS